MCLIFRYWTPFTSRYFHAPSTPQSPCTMRCLYHTSLSLMTARIHVLCLCQFITICICNYLNYANHANSPRLWLFSAMRHPWSLRVVMNISKHAWKVSRILTELTILVIPHVYNWPDWRLLNSCSALGRDFFHTSAILSRRLAPLVTQGIPRTPQSWRLSATQNGSIISAGVSSTFHSIFGIISSRSTQIDGFCSKLSMFKAQSVSLLV